MQTKVDSPSALKAKLAIAAILIVATASQPGPFLPVMLWALSVIDMDGLVKC